MLPDIPPRHEGKLHYTNTLGESAIWLLAPPFRISPSQLRVRRRISRSRPQTTW